MAKVGRKAEQVLTVQVYSEKFSVAVTPDQLDIINLIIRRFKRRHGEKITQMSLTRALLKLAIAEFKKDEDGFIDSIKYYPELAMEEITNLRKAMKEYQKKQQEERETLLKRSLA